MPQSVAATRHCYVLAPLFAVLAGAVSYVPASSVAQAQECTAIAIVCENQRPGSPPSEWQVAGAGDPTIQGFATDISVDQGGVAAFKIATSAAAYRIDIYRLGYYNGDGARLIETLGPFVGPVPQPACLMESATGLIDCGNWSETVSWPVPGDAVSGVYIARLVRSDATPGASHIIFVVRDDDGGSDILFQTSDTTWQAYNSYGGNSLYVGAPAGRAYKVSYNRPFATGQASTAHDWFFNAEYAMVRFLEKHGYDVSYFTGVDSDRSGAEILEHRVFMSVGHDEYWSGAQRANVEAARNAGRHLAFFSGNEVFWKTRWEPSIDGSGTSHRTLVSYKETHAGAKIDPEEDIWTGTWRDPRAFNPEGPRPENALTGQLFMVNEPAMFAIQVPEADGKLRLWRNTSVATLAPGQTATLASGTLGYEWDVDSDNGSRPAGLFRLSSRTEDVPSLLLDAGSTYGSGTATHSLTMYRHQSGALVFGAGTIQWSWGLDEANGGGTTPDVRMQQATVNLLADMTVQPHSLSGLAPASASNDTLAPSATITTPPDAALLETGVPVVIAGTAADFGGSPLPGVVSAVEVSTDGGATWHPAVGRTSWTYAWTPGTVGTVTIRSRAVDDSGNLGAPSAGHTVTVVTETSSPLVRSTSPSNESFGVNVTANVSALFSEPMNPATINSATFELRDSANVLVPAALAYDTSQQRAVLNPAAALALNTAYTARIVGGPSGVKDVAGNPLPATVTWSFTTAGATAPSPGEGTGGPVLVVTSAANPFNTYLTEILRAEGLNAFTVADAAGLDAALLGQHEVVVLGTTVLTPQQVTDLTAWVTAGGNLIAMRPDPQLYSLLGVSAAGSTLANAYLLFNTASGPAAGLVGETIQFHGTADRVTLAGATAVATLYSTATTATAHPAVTRRTVGAGGQAAAFYFNLAESVVLTRQGNPAWSGQERDGMPPIRSNDLFFGAAAFDPQPDWIDLSKVAIPQADEQQRLLAHLVMQPSTARAPLPRFWYFPRGAKAVVVMTGDDHGLGGTVGRFETYKAASPPNCSPDDWQCVRSSSYVYVGALTAAQAAAYAAQGFEVGLHVNTNCQDWGSLAALESFYSGQLAEFAAAFPDVPAPTTNRTHCIAWSDYTSQVNVSLANGIRLDTNYYYWPPGWVNDTPGMFTGSGMPMRFATATGQLIDVYQATTQMTDESGQSYPAHIDALLDGALGAQGYYGAFVANMHTDTNVSGHPSVVGSNAIIASAQARGVPVVSSRQLLEWLDGRNGSTFESISWNGSVLVFTVAVAPGANGLGAMLPTATAAGTLSGLTRNGVPVTLTAEIIKGVSYATFTALPGNYVATYAADLTPPAISGVSATVTSSETATITWTTNEASDSSVAYGTSPSSLSSSAGNPLLLLGHSVELDGLSPETTYYYRVTSVDASGNPATSPSAGDPPLSFVTPAVTLTDTTVADFAAGTTGASTFVASIGDGAVTLGPLVATQFDGSELPPGWVGHLWCNTYAVPCGSVTVANGVLSVDGARVNTTDFYTPGRSLEFEATFAGDAFQHSGFGVTFDDAPWAIFSTALGNGQVWARTHNGSAVIDTPIPGAFVGAPQRFRIDWNPAGVDYYINGALVASHPIAITAAMRPIAASDFNAFAGNITVDWLAMRAPYASPGTFHSRVFDAGTTTAWGAFSWSADTPPGTSLSFSVRTGNTPVPDGSWSAFDIIGASGAPVGASSRYLQYAAALTTTIPDSTPAVLGVSIQHSPAATPNDDSYTATEDTTLQVAAPGVLANDAGGSLSAILVSDVANGTLTLNADGSFSYTPAHNFNGADGFMYKPSAGASQAATVALTVTAVNDAPVAGSDAGTTEQATPLNIAVLANDSPGPADESGQSLTVTAVETSANASATINASNVITYSPAAGFVGLDTFTYTVCDNGAPAACAIGSASVRVRPRVFIDDVSVTEGHAGTVNAVLTISLTGATSETVTVQYATADGSATAGSDYTAGSGTVTFNPGQTARTVSLTVIGDTVDEPNETFLVNLSNPTNAFLLDAQGVVTIVDDDASVWATATSADFLAGTPGTATYVSETTDGEVMLNPLRAQEFRGVALAPDWQLGAATGITVSGGWVRIDGNMVGPNATYLVDSGHTVETWAKFTGTPNQNAGFAFHATNGPWAWFTTKTGGGLYAQSRIGNTTRETQIAGSWFTAAHRFRVTWTSNTVTYWINGVQVATHSINISGTNRMRPVVRDGTVDGSRIEADWVRLTPYSASGTYASRVFDAGASAAWQTATWSADVVAGTTAVVRVRTGNTPTPDGTWSAYASVASGANVGQTGRYAQFSVEMTTTNTIVTPAVRDVTLTFNRQ